MHAPRLRFLLMMSALLLTPALYAAGVPAADFKPDPHSVERCGAGYRYPQAGWIVLHIEGEPYERGYQHGQLLAPEIAAYVRCFAAQQSPKAPTEGWQITRHLVNALFVRRYEKEYLEEMKGIADGATAAGARFDGRPIDLTDIVGLNSWAEIETLDSALEATPTGLEGLRLKAPQPQAMPKPKPMHCSSFVATAPATADGKVVFGHITMFGLYPSSFFNVWLDVKPASGHRVVMQGYPGAIQSGLDYYMNDAGLLVSETTIAQTHFDVKGMAVASRIRKALQYADGIDRAVEILKEGNNGLYTNEWLMADTKTNEIAMFELGTKTSRLYRSGKGDWVGGTEGFYWGCNNTKDMEVRLETIPGVNDRPADLVFRPTDRDRAWLRLFREHRGKIDAEFGKKAFTMAPLALFPSVDAKVTTTDMAKELKSWALYGPPLGRTWEPTDDEKQKYPEIRPLVSNPWTVLHAAAPAEAVASAPKAADLPGRLTAAEAEEEEKDWRVEPSWHGTLLPKADADVWLAAAFANYERVVSYEKALHMQAKDGKLGQTERDRLAAELYAHRSGYLAAARVCGDLPLDKTASSLTQDQWYHVAAGKGVLLLHQLRRLLGDKEFAEVMDTFGRAHAGKPVTTAEFRTHVEKAAGARVKGFFDFWVAEPGLPAVKLGKVAVKGLPARADGAPLASFEVEGEVRREGKAPCAVDVTVETASGEKTTRVNLAEAEGRFTVETEETPLRVVLDKYAAGGAFSVHSFEGEVEEALIVCGSADDAAANREAAEALQKAIRVRRSNWVVPIKTDAEVSDADLKGHHLLLVGRPDANRVTERFKAALPVAFGSRSFAVRNETYAHADTAVIAAGTNPLNPRYSVVAVAGLSAAATARAAPALMKQDVRPAEVVVLVQGTKPRGLVVPPPEATRELEKP